MDLVLPEGLLPEDIYQFGFSHFGFVTLERPLSFDHYRTWIEQGFHGDMDYLEQQLVAKENPQVPWPKARSALVLAMPYFPHPKGPSPLPGNRIGMYAQGEDYHFWLKEKLQTLTDLLKARYPKETFLPMTDSAPILERDLAHRASLGWFGKNTCLIHPKKGSLFLLGEIVMSLTQVSNPSPLPDFCGTCQRCIQICPTQALLPERRLDARKCISYWTIESKQIPPVSLRSQFGDWLFGCDLCQTICPWNQKIFHQELKTTSLLTLDGDQSQTLQQELLWILESSGKHLEKKLKGSPLLRARPFGLKRNALIVIANRRVLALKASVEKFANHPRLGELARWTLVKLDEKNS